MLSAPPATFYTCPGERHAISRSVHLARLGRDYARCGECPHRHDTGLQLRRPKDDAAAPIPAAGGTILTGDGIRGRYLNDLVRTDGARFARGLAGWLWEQHPWRIETGPSSGDWSARRPIITVAVGYDERPSSPDLAIGAVQGLRQSGCRVIDIGLVTKAMWWQAVAALQADAGLMITGSGFGMGHTGCDVIGPAGRPLSAEVCRQILDRSAGDHVRRARGAGSLTGSQMRESYLAHRRGLFHALRPLRVACWTSSRLVGRLLAELFANLPCTLLLDVQPRWQNAASDPSLLDASARAQNASASFDVGLWIDEDSQGCRVYDEQGTALKASDWQTWLARAGVEDRDEGTERRVVSTSDVCPDDLEIWNRAGWDDRSTKVWPESDRPWWIEPCDRSLLGLSRAMNELHAAIGLDDRQRVWLGGTTPACDALLTLATLLRALSWSDQPLSERVGAE